MRGAGGQRGVLSDCGSGWILSHALAVRTVNEEQSFVAIPNPTIGPVATMKLCAALALASLSTALAQNPAQTLGENPARPTVGQDATLTSRSTH